MRRPGLLAALLWAIAAMPVAAQTSEPSPPPGKEAMVATMPLPGLAEGFTPQGITVMGDAVLLAGYIYPLPSKEACRVYRLGRTSPAGTAIAKRDIPTPCSHAGGLAHVGNRLFLGDTTRLIELDADRLFDPAVNPVKRVWPLEKPLFGSFLAGDRDAVWIGVYAVEGTPKLWRMPLATLDALAPDSALGTASADRALPVPLKSQGASFARDGALWLTQSGSTFGTLTRHDPRTGAENARYDMPPGIEDIGFAADGRLWAVSEAGALRYTQWRQVFPFVFAIDIKRLKAR